MCMEVLTGKKNTVTGMSWEFKLKGLTISNIQNKCGQKKLKGSESPAVL